MTGLYLSDLPEILEPLIESPHMAIVIVDKKGFITVMNQTFLDLLEMTREDVIGRYVTDILPTSKLPEVLKTGRIDRADIWAIRDRDTVVTRFPIMANGKIIGAIGQSLQLDVSGASLFINRLKEAEKDFSAIVAAFLENPYTALVIVNQKGYITMMNQTFLDILELKKEDVVGKYVTEILPNSELPEVLRTQRIDKADIWTLKGRDTLVSRMPIVKNGQVIGALGQTIFLDMSGAHILMQKLQEREKEFAAISEALIESPNMVYVIVDKDGIITAMNQTYLDELGMRKDEVVGRYVLDVTPNSQLPEVLKTGRTDKADIFIINSRATIVTRMPIIKKGIIIGAIGKSLFLDMSGAQVFMKKMQESEKEFQAISEALIESPYMVYVIVDKDGFITTMNQTYLDTLGLKKEDVVGKYILDITPTSGLQEVLDTGKIVQAEIWPIKGRDTVVTRLPVYKDGKIIGAIGKSLFLDMSGAKIFARKLQETEKELNLYKEEVRLSYQAKWELQDLIGVDKEFSATKTLAYQLSRTTSTILITGESGTGKELFAHAIHNAGNRYLAPFVRINCAALPENLLESELFGYEEGAFTGAKKGGKPGKFELAHSGTIFLDEIGDMPLTMQTKLLTVLQEKIVERVGGTRPIMISVRVIAATNRDLEKMVMEGQFRQDLYYRLNVVRLNIPPLRSRRSDIPVLVSELMNRINEELQTNVTKISCKAIELLQNYTWPGNVRELENMLERAINLADMNHESSLTISHFPSLVEKTCLSEKETLPQAVESLEKQIIIKTLKKVNGNKTQAAKLLGIHSSALYRKLSKYDLE